MLGRALQVPGFKLIFHKIIRKCRKASSLMRKVCVELLKHQALTKLIKSFLFLDPWFMCFVKRKTTPRLQPQSHWLLNYLPLFSDVDLNLSGSKKLYLKQARKSRSLARRPGRCLKTTKAQKWTHRNDICLIIFLIAFKGLET